MSLRVDDEHGEVVGTNERQRVGRMACDDGGGWRSGFAIVAAPAQHGVSAVMSFIVNQDGVVFSRNLGYDTAAVVARITRFDPDARWKRESAP